MKKILVPTDFSEYANHAFDFACEIAGKSGGVVTLLHVIEYPVTTIFNTAGEVSLDSINDVYIINLKERAEAELKERRENPKYSDINILSKIEIGNPYENIATHIKDKDADLVVMGTQGATGLREIFIGSNAEKVVRFANCPVITVPGKFEMNKINKIAYGITFDDDHSKVIMELKKYLHLFNAELNLVWINTMFDTMNEEEARGKMENLAKLHMLTNYSVNCYSSSSADNGLLYFAEENHVSMIAMGTHKRKGLIHLFAGSYAEDVVNHSSRPVWTFSLRQENITDNDK